MNIISKKTSSVIIAIGAALTAGAVSPYLARVYDYVPAPGQNVNVVPEYPAGATAAQMAAVAAEQLCGAQTPGMVTLGAFGGYITVGFDHPVVNVAGDYDFKIFGNAIVSDIYSGGGSSEPGIVMVSVDTNGDGLPNDPWYELAGSDYGLDSTVRGYQITYYRPDENKTRVPDADDPSINDATYIKWTTNNAGEPQGYVPRNVYHSQSYWPQWLDRDQLTFTGTRLAKNAENKGTTTNPYFVLYFRDWGYADNLPNATDPGFKIDWAVDDQGRHVDLTHIDFIRVYTGINQYCGWLGETSTEVCGGLDLHPDAAGITTVAADMARLGTADIYTTSGHLIARDTDPAAAGLAPGLYIAVNAGGSRKIIVR
jgi:hypothetical protein